MNQADAKKITDSYNEFLEEEFAASQKQGKALVYDFLSDAWEGFRHGKAEDFEVSPNTGVAKKKLAELGEKLSTLPEGKKYFRKISKIFKDRLAGIQEDRLDWGAAEMLAYATLLEEGHPVRLTGQDVERGTFSHRHAVVKTEDTEEEVITLNLLSDKQAPFSILQLFPFRIRSIRIRIRLLIGMPKWIDNLGSAIWRLLQRSTNYGRSVHHCW